MRFCEATLLTALVFFASTESFSAVKEDQTNMGLSGIPLSAGRSPRVVTPITDEERAGGGNLAPLESTVHKVVSTGGQRAIPAEASDDIVKMVLALSGMSHNRYKHIEVDYSGIWSKWVKTDVTSFAAWAKLGLRKIRENQLGKVMKTEQFENYVAYMKVFDDAAVAKWTATQKAPLVSADPTAGELAARAMVLAATKRDEEYAKLALGLGGLTGEALKKHANYPFYKKYYKAVLTVA